MPPPLPVPTIGARGVVRRLQEHVNSRGDRWISFELEGAGGDTECVCFPKDLQRLALDILEDDILTVLGLWTDHAPSHIRVLAVGVR